MRAEIAAWLMTEAIGLNDGRVLLDRLILKLRADRIVIPGASVVERLAAEAMHAADLKVIVAVDALLAHPKRESLDAILSDKAHARQSRLAWLREPSTRVGGCSLFEILDKIERIYARPACRAFNCRRRFTRGLDRWRARACATRLRHSSRWGQPGAIRRPGRDTARA